MQFGSGSQPNSKFQVNNNVWICWNRVQSVPEHSKLGLAHPLAFGAAAKVFKYPARGNSRGFPCSFSVVLERNTWHRVLKNTTNVPEATWGWRSRFSVGGICVTLDGCWAEKNWLSKDPLRLRSVETTSSSLTGSFQYKISKFTQADKCDIFLVQELLKKRLHRWARLIRRQPEFEGTGKPAWKEDDRNQQEWDFSYPFKHLLQTSTNKVRFEELWPTRASLVLLLMLFLYGNINLRGLFGCLSWPRLIRISPSL